MMRLYSSSQIDEHISVDGSRGYEVVDEDVDISLVLPEGDRCANCGEEIAQYVEGWLHEATGAETCVRPTGDDEDDDLAVAVPADSLPGNWVGFSTHMRDQAVKLQVSIGDPRGCLEITLRRWVDPETGNNTLLLHVPREDDPTPHVTLTPLHSGTYRIG